MQSTGRIPALLAYLLLVIGWIYVLLAHRHDKLAIYHTKQSIMLILAAVGGFIVWVVLGWVVSLIPIVGPLVATSAFALVIALYITLVINWIVGLVYALQAKSKPLPITGGWAEQLPIK